MTDRTEELTQMGINFLSAKFGDKLTVEEMREISETFLCFCSLEFRVDETVSGEMLVNTVKNLNWCDNDRLD